MAATAHADATGMSITTIMQMRSLQAGGFETARKYSREEILSILKTLSEDSSFGMILRAKGMLEAPDGTWIVRHHFRVVGTSENGEELVTFASSEYPEKPTLQQIQRSIDRYRVCLTMYGDTISDEIEKG